MKLKKRLTATEEFEILKLVLDKILWVGVALLLIGFWKLSTVNLQEGMLWIGAGAIILFIFIYIIVKEYEFVKSS